ncbi:MAG TPA: glycosyl hydrolase family 18 protein [bacterium]|mgnify:CR=1 FL=1|nr:glycosyl hydrolase family 18 protein [bacterium]
MDKVKKDNAGKEVEDSNSIGRIIRKVWVPLVIILLVIAIPLIWIKILYPTTSPLRAISYTREAKSKPHLNLSRRIIGFAPHWQLDKMGSVRLDHLTDVIFFSLTVDNEGNFAKKDSKGEDDEGWVAWNAAPANDLIAKTQITGGNAGLTVALLNNEIIKNFLNSEESQANLLNAVIKEVKRKHLGLINLDFEYTGEPADDLPPKFTSFAKRMKKALDKEVPGTELDMNLLARSGRDPRLFQIEKLKDSIDKFIVMSYDYYTGGSDSAGPVAPMKGKDEKKYFFDITTTYSDLAKIMPADKIIMGVPYYGYDWPVKDKTNPRSLALKQSDENGWVETLSYGRARTDSEFTGENCHFDELAQTPWCGYTDPVTGKDRIAWFENTESIKRKYDYAKNQNFSGVAIWSLGYDREYPDLWDILRQTFAQ